MTFGFGFIIILSIPEFCRAYAPAANPPMLTHASMDVGNIISIVIPESPDENINVDQLTVEFRQQLERIKKQSRASKVEHGLVTLKRVLPEMSREEKRKTLPLIRRVLHGRRMSNPGNGRNWTREARLEQLSEGGQYVRGRSAGIMDERRIHRDYEEIGNREGLGTRNDLTSANREDYRRISERANRREDFFKREERREDQAARENIIRRSDNTRQEELVRREDREDRREDRVVFPEEEVAAAAGKRPFQQEWNNQNWDDQSRGDARIYPETSTVDCDYKLDRSIRQNNPGNEILQGERFDKTARFMEIVNPPEEINVECARINQRISPRLPITRPDGADNPKRKDSRGFEPADVPAFVNFPREYDINASINPNCEDIKKNHSGHFFKEPQTMVVDPLNSKMQGSPNFELEDYRGSQRIIQDPREQSERSNVSGFENIPSDYNNGVKKKRGHDYFQDVRGLASIRDQQGLGDRWNSASYDDRPSMNYSDEPRDPTNVYEMFGEKAVNPGLPYVQTEQGGFRPNLDNERKTTIPQPNLGYGNAGFALRIQRAINLTAINGHIPKINLDKSILQRISRLFETPQTPTVSYHRVILVYGNNENRGLSAGDSETPTEATEKSHFTSSASMAEPSSSTSYQIPNRPLTDWPLINVSKIIPPTRAI